MRYLVIETKKNDEFVTEFENKDEAIAYADDMWARTSDVDKEKNISEYYVLESVNPDEDAEDHFEGNYVKRYK